MLNTVVKKKITPFFNLIRLNKPIGVMLLMWPCWFALSIVSQNPFEIIEWYIYFMIGSFFMRSAGCIINDIIDLKLDKKIERTAERPLASNQISIFNALIFLSIFLSLSLLILIQFKINSIIIALMSFPLIILYPFMKRYTNWPQLFLGLVFNWGILIISVEFFNKFNLDLIVLYIACIFWTLAYDTIYAYQDRKDDIKSNIKSTAVLFGSSGLKYVSFFYIIFFSLIAFLGYKSSGSIISLAVIFISIFVMIIYLNKWQLESVNSSNYYFRFNNIIGLFCFLFLLFFK